jgi:flavodoxin short chain
VFNMGKIAVVYWSGTGNTETMANLIADEAKNAGADVTIYTSGEFSSDLLNDYDVIAFGCSSMGAEELEESEFEPMFASVESGLGGKKVALFGSYGWGDGEWMRTWQERTVSDGAVLVEDGLIANESPDDNAQRLCKELGAKLAQA